LASYAICWIRFSILEHVVRSYGPVRIGTTLRQRKVFFAFERERRGFMHGSEAIDSRSVAVGLDVEEEEIESMILRLTGCDVSLEAPQDRDDRRELRKLLAEQASPEDAAARQEEDNLRRRTLFRGLKRLSERERAIIKARHMRERPATFVSLGKKFGISRERARQLEECAKAKLRRFCRVPHAPPELERVPRLGSKEGRQAPTCVGTTLPTPVAKARPPGSSDPQQAEAVRLADPDFDKECHPETREARCHS
jgi:RNA polymerase sigma-32 factor